MSQLEFNNGDFKNRKTLFVNLILPLPLPLRYTYRVPFEFNEYVGIGKRVIVQFGAKKIITGIIAEINETPPQKYEAKPLLDILDDEPTVNPNQMKLISWIAEYYMCNEGDVLNAMLPSGLKLSSESIVQLNPAFDRDFGNLTFEEEAVIENLKTRKSLTFTEMAGLLGRKSIVNVIKSLLGKNAVIIYEKIKDHYKPKKEKRVRLKEPISKNVIEEIFEKSVSSPKQEEILLEYLHHIPAITDPEANKRGLAKSHFRKNFSASSLKTLIQKSILEEYEVEISRLDFEGVEGEVNLSQDQITARDAILNSFNENKVCLLHGITGSGKTEIYIDLIKSVLESGNQVLYLLPEIALTTQIVSRLKKMFKDDMGVYHSRYSDNERVEVWKRVQEGKINFVVGARSSIFLPFTNLGLIIVDEEHESSYKQYDPAPRYNARDSALVLANMHHSKILLGSATPSLESYFNAREDKYKLVELNSRYGESTLPEFVIVDMIRETKRKKVKAEFSEILLAELEGAKEKGKQSIIFQNRRGFSPLIRCEACGHIPKCINCSVTLTYHQYKKELRCHYCGYKEPLHYRCEACGSNEISNVGYGTEKLEESLKLQYPDWKIRRMDLETTRTKRSYENILDEFEKGDIDVLVGTQMLSKGLDFEKVSLVGIVDLDRMLHFPDFRSFERTFQLSLQVSGRAGRRGEKGIVVVQTRRPDQEIVNQIVTNNYKNFYRNELAERKEHRYPPFTRILRVILKNKNRVINNNAAIDLEVALKKMLGSNRILGPEEPLIYKVRNNYLMEIIVKLEKESIDLKKAKKAILEATDQVLQKKEYKTTYISFDVDPG